MTKRLIIPTLLLLTLVVGGCNPARMEDRIADLEGDWFGITTSGYALDLEIAENGSTLGNYGSYYFSGRASLYGTQFELTSLDIDMTGRYIAESERLEGDLYDNRGEEQVVDGFILYRVEE
jgi:hypothetical protein